MNSPEPNALSIWHPRLPSVSPTNQMEPLSGLLRGISTFSKNYRWQSTSPMPEDGLFSSTRLQSKWRDALRSSESVNGASLGNCTGQTARDCLITSAVSYTHL